MVAALLAILAALRSVVLFEFAAAVLVVAGAWVQWGGGVALLVAGSCAALKSYDMDRG